MVAARIDGRWRLLGLAPLVPAAAYGWAAQEPGFRHQLSAVLSTSAAKLSARHQLHDGIVRDLVFIACVVALAVAVRLACRERLVPPYRSGRWYARPTAWLVVIAAAGLDAVEDVLLWLAADHPHAHALAMALAVVGWVMLAAYAAALVVVYATLVGPLFGALGTAGLAAALNAVADRVSKTPERDGGEVAKAPAPAKIPTAICLSGGGIRSAAFALGAVRRLDADQRFATARWLCSVSGGGYLAGGWRVSRQAPTTSEPEAGPTVDGLFAADTAWSRHVVTHERYLDNGPGGAWAAVIAVVLPRLVLVLGSIVGAAVVAGYVAGLYVSTDAVVGGASTTRVVALRPGMFTPFFPVRLWLPGVAVLALAGAVAIAAAVVRRPAWRALARGLVTVAAALVVVLLAVPIAVALGPSILGWVVGELTRSHAAKQASGGLATVLSVLSALGVVSAVVGVVTRRLQKLWLRLGGVLLALGLLVVLVLVARYTSAARTEHMATRLWLGTIWHVPTLVWASLILLGAMSLADTHRVSLAGIYRKRIAATFMTTGPDAVPIDYRNELSWPALRGRSGPELVMATTVASSRRTASGIQGCGLTFDPYAFRLHDGAGSCAIDSSAYPCGSFWRGYPRTWSVSRAMAISGAAVASSLGRANLGTTNAVLAALNVRLGMWLPNPRFAHEWFTAPAAHGDVFAEYDQPRVGLAYLLKELLGRYRIDADPFVYVTDGGHRENLGLVEALRLHPGRVLVVDASGDAPDSFGTLRAAIALAQLELGATIEMQWDAITRPAGAGKDALPPGCVATGTVTYADGGTAQLIYGKDQVTAATPPAVRDYAARNATFPNYSTVDQFLTPEEFANLVALGEYVGGELSVAAGAGPVLP